MRRHRSMQLSRRMGIGLLLFGFLCASSLEASGTTARAALDRDRLNAFKGTGCSSLAIGVPDEGVDGISGAGQVHVLESIHAGATTTLVNHLPPFFNQDSEDSLYHPVEDQVENSDSFGYSLAMGDFNADGYDDLAIGVPIETIGTADFTGAVEVMYGSSNALSAENDYLWNQGSPGMDGALEESDEFGFSLAVGDFDGDGYYDLAIGVPYEDVGSPVVADGGLVQIMYGSSVGLDNPGNQIWDQSLSSIQGTEEIQELFGYSLAAGDFDGDGFDDLAIGVPFDNYGGFDDTGGVNVLYGSSPNGLTGSGDQLINQDYGSILDDCETSDHFGKALAEGDFNGDGRDDLAIGAPMEDIFDDNNGMAAVLYGTAAGLGDAGNQVWSYAQDEAHFGKSMTAGDFDGDGYDDLAVGIPDLDIDSLTETGAVSIIYGTSTGLDAVDRQLWHQDNIGVAENEDGDQFGYSLAAGDFDCDRIDDLAIGIPFKEINSMVSAGMLIEMHGSTIGLSDSAA